MKTAVEWLIEELRKHEFLGTFCTPEELENKKNHVESIIKQAKQMEKEQIIKAHGNKQKTKSNPDSIVTYGYTFTGEMYYDKTFKK